MAYTWAKRVTVADATRSGRPVEALTQETKERIDEIIKDQWGASIRKTAKLLNRSQDYITRGKTISPSSVCRYVRSTEWGRIAYRARSAPMLTSKNICDRLSFARKVASEGYCAGTEEARLKLSHILFTDESCIELFPAPNSQNTRIRTRNAALRVPIRRPKHGLKVMIAGGLTANGLTELHIVPPSTNINGDYYRRHILPMYFSGVLGNSTTATTGLIFSDAREITFMQDGAPAHTATSTLNLLGGMFRAVWSRGVWPGNSPDLNPIEHLWAVLQNSVFDEPRPRTRNELIDRLHSKWRSISRELTTGLVFSLPRRIAQCIERNGGVRTIERTYKP